jgi:hypothetical protein
MTNPAAVAMLARAAVEARRRALDASDPQLMPADVIARGRYRCRVHPEQPVTWKGTGCPELECKRASRRPRRHEEYAHDHAC